MRGEPILRGHEGWSVNRQRLPIKLLFIGLPNSRKIIETSALEYAVLHATRTLRLVQLAMVTRYGYSHHASVSAAHSAARLAAMI
jgi:hypothetical protein